ncbi:hypothetical protein [Paenibacillus dendritiformis]|uniref:hypothetical protein n=1 Tax=Paenibacillus dendritiformis TaxID=130049 RepID=UPI00387E0A67
MEEKAGGAPNQYEDDLRGTLTRVTQGSKALESFTFEETNRLVKVVEDGKTSEYRYDGLGARSEQNSRENVRLCN